MNTNLDTNDEKLLAKEEIFQIVGCAIEVLNTLGHGLVDAIVDWARQHGAERICLSVEARNDEASRLYTRCGFVRAEPAKLHADTRTQAVAIAIRNGLIN